MLNKLVNFIMLLWLYSKKELMKNVLPTYLPYLFFRDVNCNEQRLALLDSTVPWYGNNLSLTLSFKLDPPLIIQGACRR